MLQVTNVTGKAKSDIRSQTPFRWHYGCRLWRNRWCLHRLVHRVRGEEMRQTVQLGKPLDFLTQDELVRLLPRPLEVTRIRATETIQLDATGSGQDEVYKVPMGYEFAARRVTLDIGGATDPSTGNVPLNVAGKFVAYLRSGARIEYAVPISPNTAPQVPGVQTWAKEQGPYLRNGEVFEVQAKGLTASAVLTVVLEGLLTRPPVA